MRFDEIEERISRIVAIVAKVPDEFKERTFEALLAAALADVRGSGGGAKLPEHKPAAADGHVGATLESQADANIGAHDKAKGRYLQFLTDRNISEADVRKIVEIEGNEVIFYRTPDPDVKSAAQISWALLLALANGLRSGNFTVSSDAVRQKVNEEKIYDQANFAKTFRAQKAYFAGAMGNGDAPRRLSSDGEDALAALIKTMAA